MNLDIVSWRSIVGTFCAVKALSRMINKYKLLTFAFKLFIMCLWHFVNCVLMAIFRHFCVCVYLVCLLIWCGYFCLAVRFYTLISHFTKNHPFMFLYIYQWWVIILILRDGDVHPLPGSQRNLLKFMHWNLNSLIAHDGIRIPIIQAYNLLHSYDLIAITETALNEYTSDETI